MPCQHKFVLKLGNVVDKYDFKTTVLLDPAGLSFIQKNNTRGAGQASGSIYTKFGINRFPPAVRNKIKNELEACYHNYDDGPSLPQAKIIHAVGPQLSHSTSKDHQDLLTLVYTNIFTEFLQNCSPDYTLRLVPISSGSFNIMRYTQPQLAVLSLHALFQGLKYAEVSEKSKKVKNIELYLFDELMYDAFLAEIQKTGIPSIE